MHVVGQNGDPGSERLVKAGSVREEQHLCKKTQQAEEGSDRCTTHEKRRAEGRIRALDGVGLGCAVAPLDKVTAPETRGRTDRVRATGSGSYTERYKGRRRELPGPHVVSTGARAKRGGWRGRPVPRTGQVGAGRTGSAGPVAGIQAHSGPQETERGSARGRLPWPERCTKKTCADHMLEERGGELQRRNNLRP
ncbi:hypothetical protein NDU88_006689 [Pleurodeles waltl]|uniref:Uncharacterized protein n=1 Tax=Pleurodeles waltl TaxID=8319 RepID=A0AAV7X1D7_PLEWA|nr:hypothetical protein NDU88_006689 [Pleurodeles waltl]